jgi:DNA polymerase-3 subunit delta'
MQRFEELEQIQPVAVKMLKKMINHNRIAHAYLIHGDPGTKKRAIAETLALRLFCRETETAEPCLTCRDCKRVLSRNHPDLHWIKPDGLSIKKEQIEALQREFIYSGVESNRKVYVIEDADLMTVNASNRLLKFLEEPSQETTAILLTKNQQQLLDTIRSRCQVIALRPLSGKAIETALIESGITKENARIFQAIAPQLEEAKALDQDEWFAEARKLMVQLVGMLIDKPQETLLFIEKHWMQHFNDRDKLLLGLDLLLLWFKDLMYLHIGDTEHTVLISYQAELERVSLRYTRKELVAILSAITSAKQKLNQHTHPTLVMEQLTLQMQR